MTILNELDAQTLANYALRSGERSRARRAEAENIKKDWVDKADGKHKSVERDAERLERGEKRAREKIDAKFDDSKEGKAAKAKVISKAAGQASNEYDGNTSFTSKINFDRGLNGLRRDRGRGGDDEVTNLWFGDHAGANKANALKDRVSALSRAAHDKSNYHQRDDKKALDKEVKDQAKDKSFFRGTRSTGRAILDTASKIKNATKRGVKSVSSGLSSLKKRVFGEEYYEDLDYRYTVIPLLDSLLEGNSSDIEYAFNEAVSHRIENAILTARLRIAEELDEARAGYVHDVMDSDGNTRTNFVRPKTPEQRKELADGIRSTRRQNRQIRDDIVDNPYDRKDIQKSELDQANANSRGVRSAYKAKNYETTKMQGSSPREGGRKATVDPYMGDKGYRTGAVDFDEKGNAKPRFPGASRVNVEYGKHIRAGDGKAPKRKREIFPQD